MHDLRIYTNPSLLVQAAVEFIVDIASRSVGERGFFSVLLSGGSTPRDIYQRLADIPLSDRLAWENIYLFWGDERCVPPEDVNSNYRMVRENLLERTPIPTGNVFRVRGEFDPELAASQYEQDILHFFAREQRGASARPSFDLILLGMGPDGHTASLFPHSPAIYESSKLVMAVEHTQPPPPIVPRITATPVLINAGGQVVFFVSGTEKAKRLAQVLSGPYQPDSLPVQIVRPKSGRLTWFLDQAAASRLPEEDQSMLY